MSDTELDEILGMSHRILVMRQGSIIQEFKHKGTDKAEVMRYVSGDINNKKQRKD